MATCCCCPCNAMLCFASQEVVTEEIFFVSDALDPPEKPFLRAVQRNPCRVWNFRLAGWGVMYMGLSMVLQQLPLIADKPLPLLKAFGGLAPMVLDAMLTLSIWAVVVAAVYSCYRPAVSVKCCLAVGIVIATPLLWERIAQAA
ncbi:unnamed protein product [Polarella glacialis]|uniref:Uncharacterized protein n=1 Tax=Polarella glacialis TaxID=89957 RepID=A0A813D3G9_POLGL|nr:unnamed protein product [Polarella glacialis]